MGIEILEKTYLRCWKELGKLRVEDLLDFYVNYVDECYIYSYGNIKLVLYFDGVSQVWILGEDKNKCIYSSNSRIGERIGVIIFYELIKQIREKGE